MKQIRTALSALPLLPLLACTGASSTPGVPDRPAVRPSPAVSELEAAPDVAERLRKLPPTKIEHDHALLDAREAKVLAKLIEAAKPMDEIYFRQVWRGNPSMREKLNLAVSDNVRGASEARALFTAMKGPWDRLDENHPFLGSKPKPANAGFYPDDASKEEIEKWIADHPADKEAFQGLFTVIRRDGDKLVAVPFSKEYRPFLEESARLLREAAALTGNASLRNYLTLRADAFLTDDYYASDLAWMDLDSDIEVVIGPYETYEDAWFGWKASFEAFVTVRDKGESEKLMRYTSHLPAMERGLPIPDEHKNPNRGKDSPIRVVQEAYTAGDARSAVMTAAFNLPNDERVRESKGSKKVMLKNVMEAKFRLAGRPIAERVMATEDLPKLSFDAFFTHVLFHELSHALGPGMIQGPGGERVDNRILLKETYSTLEECKADVLGVWNLFYAIDQKLVDGFGVPELLATNLGLHFRSLRFGLNEAHGRGTAIQWNWYREKGAIVRTADSRYKVDAAKYRKAVESLAHEILMIQAVGDYEAGKKLLATYGVETDEIRSVNERLKDLPVDLRPVFTAAGEM